MTKTPIRKFVSCFLVDEDGAVTVDWVMLTAGIVLLGVMVTSGIKVSLGAAATSIANTISTGLT